MMKSLSYGAMLLLLLTGCRKNQTESVAGGNMMQTSSSVEIPIAADSMPTQLGDQLANPYTIANMQTVKDSLALLGIHSHRPFTVRVTHRYIRFMPVNEAQLDDLTADTSLFFYDYPLDYEILVQGNFYREAGLSESVPTYQYVVIPDGHVFNTTIPHTVLDSLYLPEEDTMLLGAALNMNFDYGQKLVESAFDKVDEVIRPFTPWEDGAGDRVFITPKRSGQIRVFDNRLNEFIGLHGVEVTARSGWRTRSGFTDANGNYTLSGDPFNNTVTYTIHFRRHGKFRIMNSKDVNDAQIVRSGINSNTWNYDIPDGLDRMHATMFRAAYRYTLGNADGLKRPIRNLRDQKLISKNKTKDWAGMNYYFFPNLKVARFEGAGNTNEFDCDEIYGITIHELAHTAHVLTMNSAINYMGVDAWIAESWAVACQWHLTNLEYRERGIPTYGDENYVITGLRRPHIFAYQYWNKAEDLEYTSLFINLFDNFNEFPTGPNFPNDQVSGYNLATIQANYLKHMYSYASLTSYLKANKPAGVTDAQIDLLLSSY